MSAPQIARQVAYVPQMHEEPFLSGAGYSAHGACIFIGPFDVPSEEDVAIAKSPGYGGHFRLKDRPYTQLSGGGTAGNWPEP